MKNTYYLMRHAQSEANKQGIVVSDPLTACQAFGITELGHRQIEESIDPLRDVLNENTVIVSSDFLRAKETAEKVAEMIGVKKIQVDSRLRDRFFGDFEGQSDQNYEKIWELDRTDPEHTKWNNESTNAVQKRMQELLNELEKIYSGKTILLVSHGDPLQIIFTSYVGKNVGQHRDIHKIENAEIRDLEFALIARDIDEWQRKF